MTGWPSMTMTGPNTPSDSMSSTSSSQEQGDLVVGEARPLQVALARSVGTRLVSYCN